MHAISLRSDVFLGCSSQINVLEPAYNFTIMLLLTALQFGFLRLSTTTAMVDSKCLNTSLLEVLISSNNEHVFFRDLSDHTLQIKFHA
jgi:hypothetical protein